MDGTSPLSLRPQTPNFSLIVRKTSGKSQLRNILQNTPPRLLKTVKILETKESLRNGL